MASILPEDSVLPISRLSSVFSDTTNSYKFYWFLAILEELKENGDGSIAIESLLKRMMNAVWFPLDYFRLSFGKADGFKNVASFISSHRSVDISSTAATVMEQVDNGFDKQAKRRVYTQLKQLGRWVPYRFIRPFFLEQTRNLPDTRVNSTIVNLANSVSAHHPEYCIYHFSEDAIEINKYWKEYLLNHYGILVAFIHWHLVKFVQRHNPNVVGISEKLFKPTYRNLRGKIESWRLFLSLNSGIKCIYSGTEISNEFSLDHFVPWSYVVHDLNWNLVPTTPQINSRKGDCLPSSKYLSSFIDLQYSFFQRMVLRNERLDVLEDYCLLFNRDVAQIAELPYNEFELKFRDTLLPMIQIGANMGFKPDWLYTIDKIL